MIKSLVAVAMLYAAPLVAFAVEPMSMYETSDRLADNPAVVAADPASIASLDATDAPVDEPHEAMSAQGASAPHTAAMHPDAAHAPATPAHGRKGAVAVHKDHSTTRWQSLLPGVMK